VKQLQVSVPKKLKEEAEEILQDYSSDISSSEAEKNNEKVIQFTVTSESEDIDELTQDLKDIENMDNGDLSIRVIKQESLIRKGQETQGSSSILSQEELYSKAQESADFNMAQWGLIGLSSVIAAFGLVSNNLIAVIGAMMLAPLLSPFVSGALSLTVGDRKLMISSIKAGVLSVLIAVALSYVAVIPFPLNMNPTLRLVSTPSIISILLSVFVGAAAALTFVTGLRDEIAGVAVAIALVPPIASIGIGMKMSDLLLVTNAITVAIMNMLSVIISGYLCFRVLGLKPSTYYKKKQAEKIKYLVPAALLVFGLLAAPVAYSSYQNYEDYISESQLEKDANEYFGDKLLQTNLEGSTAIFYVIGEVNAQEFKEKTSSGREIRVIQLQTIN
jgi:uncharacterized hydrophobic protein (TIGR00341 family)